MSTTDKISVKEIVVGAIILIVVLIAMGLTITAFLGEGKQTEVSISDAGEKSPNRVEVYVKLLSFDAVKGDVAARVEFDAKGTILAEDNTLTQPLKFFVNSANGKQEIDFPKGKRMTPVEVVFNTHGNVAEYPFDHHEAGVEIYITPGKADDKKPAEKLPAADENGEPKKPVDALEDVPIVVDFWGSLPGYKIKSANTKDSDENYVFFNIDITRSTVTEFFSIFVGILMWGMTTGVLFLMTSVTIRGRKPEVSMFSFMAALLFAFYTVRNSQPNVPPIGILSDFFAFFWAEVIVAASLLIVVLTWIFRPAK